MDEAIARPARSPVARRGRRAPGRCSSSRTGRPTVLDRRRRTPRPTSLIDRRARAPRAEATLARSSSSRPRTRRSGPTRSTRSPDGPAATRCSCSSCSTPSARPGRSSRCRTRSSRSSRRRSTAWRRPTGRSCATRPSSGASFDPDAARRGRPRRRRPRRRGVGRGSGRSRGASRPACCASGTPSSATPRTRACPIDVAARCTTGSARPSRRARATSLDEEVGVLALHFHEAQRWDKSWRYGRQAGDRAMTIYAIADASRFYELSLEAGQRLRSVGARSWRTCTCAGAMHWISWADTTRPTER